MDQVKKNKEAIQSVEKAYGKSLIELPGSVISDLRMWGMACHKCGGHITAGDVRYCGCKPETSCYRCRTQIKITNQ